MWEKPSDQQSIFFKWCAKNGITNFDIQFRIPKEKHDGEWQWLSPIKNISIGYYFLKLSSWCKYINAQGGDVFIRPHGVHKQSLLFLDDLSIKKAMALNRKYASCIICTSKNNTQVWLATSVKLSKFDRMKAQSYLKNLGYTDPGSVSGDHLGRLCGFKSQKRNCWVNLLQVSYGTKYEAILNTDFSRPLGQECVYFKTPGLKSESEMDFGWIIGLLKSGISESEGYTRLFKKSVARNKRNPKEYSQRTVSKAVNLFLYNRR